MADIDGVEVDVSPAPGIEVPVARGPRGNAVELQTSATHIQWRVIGSATWNDLVPLADIEGTPGGTGPAPEIQVAGGFIQWREPEGVWQNLIAVADLEGDPGADSTVPGPQGDGFTGGSYNAATGEVTFTSDDGLGFTTGDLRGTPGADGDTHVPDPSGEADGRMLSVQSGALVYGDAPAGGGGAVDSVNGATGAVVLDADDIDDTATTNKFATAAELAQIATATQPGDLAPVATSGAYGDLTGTPTLGTAAAAAATDFATAAQGALAATAVQPGDLATVATTGAYSDLTGTPAIPDGVPDDTGSTDGDVLTTDGAGTFTWETPTGGGFGPWTSFTPALHATSTDPDLGTSPTQAGRYRTDGTTVEFECRIQFGSSPSAGSGTYRIATPGATTHSATTTSKIVGAGYIYDSSAGMTEVCTIYAVGGDTSRLGILISGNGASQPAHNAPWSWSTGDIITARGSYEMS